MKDWVLHYCYYATTRCILHNHKPGGIQQGNRQSVVLKEELFNKRESKTWVGGMQCAYFCNYICSR